MWLSVALVIVLPRICRTSPAKTALCTLQGICQTNILDPGVDIIPPGGVFSYAKTSPSTGIYVSSIIQQQGFSLSDSMTLSSRWIVRLAASQDWTWTDSYTDSGSTGYAKTWVPTGYVSQGVSPSESVIFKPRPDMTLYATFVDSISSAGCRGGE
jgi:iron complex outermembrane receptor protein